VHSAVSQRDLTAFGILVRRYQDQALRTAYSLLGAYAGAEDAVQEAFLLAWQHLHQLKSASAFPTWLRRIVRTECERQRQPSTLSSKALEIEPADLAPGPDEQLEASRFRQRLLQEVQKLSDPLRAAFSLYYLADSSVSEIATLLELSSGAVRKRLHDARRQLRYSFTDEELQMSKDEIGDNIGTPNIERPEIGR
jgi:RNA polymerase sigma-70 factor, ECF subfamily